MTEQDKQRIEKEANEWVDYNSGGAFHLVPSQSESYIAGATRENERMAELLKEERNKAIDDVVVKIDERISGYTYIEGEDIAMLIRELMELKPILESLKGKSQ